MMSRLIDQFHEPEDCKRAAMEAEKLTRELRALANALETNECPDEIYRRFREEEQAAQATNNIKENVSNKLFCDRLKNQFQMHAPEGKCPETVGCDCNKRNGLQDECLRLCCKGKKYRH